MRIKKTSLRATGYATFADKETAELWCKFKENIINEMAAFEVKGVDLITLKDAIDLKIKDLETKDKKDSINDTKIVIKEFKDFLHIPVNKITSEMLMVRVKEMQKEFVYKGGSGDGKSGIRSLQSHGTILRKIRNLSSIFGFILSQGAEFINPTISVLNRIKEGKETKKGKNEQNTI